MSANPLPTRLRLPGDLSILDEIGEVCRRVDALIRVRFQLQLRNPEEQEYKGWPGASYTLDLADVGEVVAFRDGLVAYCQLVGEQGAAAGLTGVRAVRAMMAAQAAQAAGTEGV